MPLLLLAIAALCILLRLLGVDAQLNLAQVGLIFVAAFFLVALSERIKA